MATASETIREVRRQVVRVAPDGLDRLDLLITRSMLLHALETIETLTLHLEGNPMTTAFEHEVDFDIDELIGESKEKAEAEYRQLVFDLAEGKQSATGAAIHSILFAASRTVADLKRHVALAKSRQAALGDKAAAAELQETLPGLLATRESTFAAHEEKRKQQRRELQPLVDENQQAVEAYNRCKQQARDLARGADNFLARTVSKEYRDEFDRLSTTACRLAQAVEAEKVEDRKAHGELPEIETQILKLELELPRLDGIKSSEAKAAAENTRTRIAELREKVDAIERGDKLSELIAQHEAAKAALEKHTANRDDWRNVNFD